MRFWFFPCESGDFRLEPAGDDVLLTVEDPTVDDYRALQPFLAAVASMNWLPPDERGVIKPRGLTKIRIRAPMDVLGPMLVGAMHSRDNVWTAVRASSGRVVLNDGVTLALPAPPPVPQIEQRDPTTALAAPAPPEVPVAAATVPPPTRGCPPPTACQRRASEVLRTFCTLAQWDSWNASGFMQVTGSHSGANYRIYHRDEAAARGHRHILVAPRARDVSWARSMGGIPEREVCVWDHRRPPEEEALAVKLAVEHREDWLMATSVGGA